MNAVLLTPQIFTLTHNSAKQNEMKSVKKDFVCLRKRDSYNKTHDHDQIT